MYKDGPRAESGYRCLLLEHQAVTAAFHLDRSKVHVCWA